jgi:hypothetical protein
LDSLWPRTKAKEAIAGAQGALNDLTPLEIALKDYPVAERSWAYMKKDAFLLVKHDFPPPWFTASTKR